MSRNGAVEVRKRDALDGRVGRGGGGGCGGGQVCGGGAHGAAPRRARPGLRSRRHLLLQTLQIMRRRPFLKQTQHCDELMSTKVFVLFAVCVNVSNNRR